MNNAAFGKTIENVRKDGNIKIIAAERRTDYLVSEPNYYTKKFFSKIYQQQKGEKLKY